MNKHTLRLLSFQSIIDELKEYTAGEAAKTILDEQVFYKEKESALLQLYRTTAMRKIMESGASIPALDLPDCSPALRILKKEGTVLEETLFGNLLRMIHTTHAVKRFLEGSDIPAELSELGTALPCLPELQKEIAAIVDKDGGIQYGKIPSLSKLQSTIKRARAGIEKRAASYMNSSDYNDFFQTDIATLKDGRTVLPLKAQFKGRIKGIIHEVSSSGQTLFLEPEDIVEMNNELVMQETALKNEVLRLLRELTGKTREYLPEIRIAHNDMAYIDTVFAKARYSVLHKCQPALFHKKDIILVNARHPLLGKQAVPVNYSLAENTSILLITGPNTGGKTVTVKTLGILAVMNQFGMEIPADEGTMLPLFDDVFADIGDEQSIEQSLSTFQAHMKNISSICRKAGPLSLVVLDELGAGTDPEEGTAIAMALLDNFIEKKTKVLATTHHGILKNYGYMKDGVMNASMEFNAEKLIPTYKVIMGIPGESHALTIAEHTGIPKNIILKAEEYLNEERTDISRLIDELSREKIKLIEQEEQQQKIQKAAVEKIRDISLKELSLQQQERILREKGLTEISGFLKESRKTLEHIIKEVREGGKQEAIDEGRRLLEMIENKSKNETERIHQLEALAVHKENDDEAIPAETGAFVRINSSGQEGRIIRIGRNNKYVIEAGSLRVTLTEKDFTVISGTKKNKDIPVEIVTPSAGNSAPAAFELNVLGFRADEALRSLEKQMDAALVQGMADFTILHGKGTGILQQTIHEYLRASPYVEDFHFARPEFGGSGKTVVSLRR